VLYFFALYETSDHSYSAEYVIFPLIFHMSEGRWKQVKNPLLSNNRQHNR